MTFLINSAPVLYYIFGGLSLVYFLILWIYCGHIPAFGGFWAGIGICFIVAGLIRPSFLAPWGVVVVGILFLLVLSAAGILYWKGNRRASGEADYLIVLGAKVNGKKASRALQNRIQKAFDYLKDNPQTKAVLTGGRGYGEEIPEALCMKQELMRLGIEEQRLFLEDKSTTTIENIAFAGNIIEEKDKPIIIVTNDFHAFRGTYLAKRSGFQKVESLGAPSTAVMQPHYYTREILSWIKIFIIRRSKI